MHNSTNNSRYKLLRSCIACGSIDLQLTLNLKSQPLANNYVLTQETLETFPLSINTCKKCFHTQLGVSVEPEIMFENYAYVSGTSKTLSRYFDRFAENIIKTHGGKGKLLDIGSNDGSFLEKFKNTDWNTIGVDPAINLIVESHSKGVATIPSFFNSRISDVLANNFDVIVAMNVFAHTKEPLEILKCIELCLSSSGTAYIQTSQANMFEYGQFDTVYHEHISFFNVRSMKALLARTNLTLIDVRIEKIHGDSYLWVVKKSSGGESTLEREIYEENIGLYNLDTYSVFETKATSVVEEVKKILEKFRNLGFQVAGYGAAAKGNTFLNFSEIDLDYFFDDTPQKIGKYAPAGNCKVSNPIEMMEIDRHLLFIIPAWNFKKEIVDKISTIRKNKHDAVLTYFPFIEVSELNT